MSESNESIGDYWRSLDRLTSESSDSPPPTTDLEKERFWKGIKKEDPEVKGNCEKYERKYEDREEVHEDGRL